MTADRVLDDVLDALGLDEETTTDAGRAMAFRVIRAALSEAEDSAVQGEIEARFIARHHGAHQ